MRILDIYERLCHKAVNSIISEREALTVISRDELTRLFLLRILDIHCITPSEIYYKLQ